jgi:hypothetical protein
MKHFNKFVLSIIFLCFSFLPLSSSQINGNIHQTFGLYQNGPYGITGHVLKYDSYQMQFKTQTGYRYRYEIYMFTRSTAYGQYRNTIVQGSHVFVNGQNVSIIQYPYGLNYVVSMNGTMIYYWETNDPMPTFNVTWQNLQIQ